MKDHSERKLEASADFSRPTEKRGCTDIFGLPFVDAHVVRYGGAVSWFSPGSFAKRPPLGTSAPWSAQQLASVHYQFPYGFTALHGLWPMRG